MYMYQCYCKLTQYCQASREHVLVFQTSDVTGIGASIRCGNAPYCEDGVVLCLSGLNFIGIAPDNVTRLWYRAVLW